MTTLHRRSFLTGLATFLAAPAIVRAASLMPVRVLSMDTVEPFGMTEWALDQGDVIRITDVILVGDPDRILRDRMMPRQLSLPFPLPDFKWVRVDLSAGRGGGRFTRWCVRAVRRWHGIHPACAMSGMSGHDRDRPGAGEAADRSHRDRRDVFHHVAVHAGLKQ